MKIKYFIFVLMAVLLFIPYNAHAQFGLFGGSIMLPDSIVFNPAYQGSVFDSTLAADSLIFEVTLVEDDTMSGHAANTRKIFYKAIEGTDATSVGKQKVSIAFPWTVPFDFVEFMTDEAMSFEFKTRRANSDSSTISLNLFKSGSGDTTIAVTDTYSTQIDTFQTMILDSGDVENGIWNVGDEMILKFDFEIAELPGDTNEVWLGRTVLKYIKRE